MNILTVNITDVEGRRFNGLDLTQMLNKDGHNAHMITMTQKSTDSHVHNIMPGYKYLKGIIRRIEDLLSVQSWLYPAPILLLLNPLFWKADIVHYHLIDNRWFSILALPILTRLKPSILTLHNHWWMTGHCVHPGDCNKWQWGCSHCPDLKSQWNLRTDTTRLLWKVKRWVVSKSRINIVTTTYGMARRVKKSRILRQKPVTVIPLGVSEWDSDQRDCQDDKVYVCFRNPAHPDPFKNMDYIIDTLDRFKFDNMELVVIGPDKGLDKLRHQYPIRNFETYDESIVKTAMALCDIFLMPSTQESFGLMALESMASGTPVITNKDIPTAEVVGTAGVVINIENKNALGNAIKTLCNDPELLKDLSQRAVKRAKLYTLDKYYDVHVKLYQKIYKL